MTRPFTRSALLVALSLCTFAACSSTGAKGRQANEEEPNQDEDDPTSKKQRDADAGADDHATCAADLLNDPAHCGRCGHDCLGGGCVAGQCQPTIIGTSKEFAEIRARDSKLYFLVPGEAKFRVVDGMTGAEGAPVGDGDHFFWLTTVSAVDEEGAYVSATDDTDGPDHALSGSLNFVPWSGGPSEQLLERPNFALDFTSTTVANGTLYFAIKLDAAKGKIQLFSMPSHGGPSKTLASLTNRSPHGLLEHGGRLYLFSNVLEENGDVHGLLSTIPTSGGSETVLVSFPPGEDAIPITFDASGGLYFTHRTVKPSTPTRSDVVRFDVTTKVSNVVLADKSAIDVDAWDIRIDETSIYWFERNLGLRRKALQGGVAVTIAADPTVDTTNHWAMDDKAIYWIAPSANAYSSSIMKLAK